MSNYLFLPMILSYTIALIILTASFFNKILIILLLETNSLASLNIPKCTVFSFPSPVLQSFTATAYFTFHTVNSISDLGFTLSLSPVMHIESICCKTLKLIGFILHSSEFHLPSALKVFYCVFSAFILKYGCVLWDPSTAESSAMVERVQRKFYIQPPIDYIFISSS